VELFVQAQKITYIFLLIIFFNFSLKTSIIKNICDIKNHIFITKLSFESDVPFNKDEFLYLTDLSVGMVVSAQKILKAQKTLMQKNRFYLVDIVLSDFKNGKHITFILKGNWILKKLNFKGITFGKQHYMNIYSQQPGDVFNSTLHEESIKSLKQKLYNEGYFSHAIFDELSYIKKHKTIVVTIFIKKGPRIFVNDVFFSISSKNRYFNKNNETGTIRESLTKRFREILLNVPYEKTKIEKCAKKIRYFIKNKGFCNPHIFVTKTTNKKKTATAIMFNIMLGEKSLFSFDGNTVFSDLDLKNKVIGLDQPDWLLSPDIVSEQIMNGYFKKGYWNTSVHYKEVGMRDYHFTIKEKDPVLIEQIEIKNAITLKAKKTTDLWEELLKKEIFDQQLLHDGMEKLKSHYFSKGFWDFSIVEKRFVKNYINNKYSIVLFVRKGKQRIWGGSVVKIVGDMESDGITDFSHLNVQQKKTAFNFVWLQEQKIWLINHFQKKGYWYVKVQPHFHILPITKFTKTGIEKRNKKVTVLTEWRVDPGKQIRFGTLFVRGNTKLPFKHILKEVCFSKGDLWNKEKLELTRKKLKQLDMFKQIHLQPHQLSNRKSKKPVILTLIDDDPIELRFRFGYFLSNKNFLFKRQSTSKFGGTVLFKNLTNRADKLILDSNVTQFAQKLNITYQQPAFLYSSVSGKIKGYANKYIHQGQIGFSSSGYESIQNGFLVEFSDEYKNDYFWAVTVGNEWIKTSRMLGDFKLEKSMINHMLPYFFIEPTVIIDKRDDKINTTKGIINFISLKFMIPELSGIVTARIAAEQSFFFPIRKNIVFAARIRFGHVLRRSFEYMMPIERFYLGGPNSVRGYEKDGLPPMGITKGEINGKKYKELTIQGGSSMINANFEIRFPLFNKIGAVIFQDIGVLSQSSFLGFSKKWYPSSGFGLRYQTPIGAVRFDIGWKWKKFLENDFTYAWYLTLGESF
jgi:outer membrane protein insertion porin family